MLNYDAVRNFRFEAKEASYTARDAAIYALALGFGDDPMDERRLRFVTETDQLVAPTMPVVFCHPGFWIKEPTLGLDWRKFVHASQSLELKAPLHAFDTIVGRTENVIVADRGEGNGAVVVQRRELSSAASGKLVAVLESSYLARGDGGFSVAGGKTDPLPPAGATAAPAGEPDAVRLLATLPMTALLYRQSGDLNPLHSSPAVAKSAGFDRPILQGLCTFGVAARGILDAFCDYDPARLASVSARFSAPVLPGETLKLAMWRSGTAVEFTATAVERDVQVLKGGRATLA